MKLALVASKLASMSFATPIERSSASDCGFVNVFYDPLSACEVVSAVTLDAVLKFSVALKVPASGKGLSNCASTDGATAQSFEVCTYTLLPSETFFDTWCHHILA